LQQLKTIGGGGKLYQQIPPKRMVFFFRCIFK